MKLQIDDELRDLLRGIADQAKSEDEWAEIESDDMFQSENYVGGYDSDESAFCFSCYSQGREEYWFQVDLGEIDRILAGDLSSIEMKPADK